MKYFHLIWAALFRRKTRTFLTLASILAAFLLFGAYGLCVGFKTGGLVGSAFTQRGSRRRHPHRHGNDRGHQHVDKTRRHHIDHTLHRRCACVRHKLRQLDACGAD